MATLRPGTQGRSSPLAMYLLQLRKNPLRTKIVTAGTLAGLQEFLASFLANDRNKNGGYFTSRVYKMALYGGLVSAPLGHFLIWALQKSFAGHTSTASKMLQILVSNLSNMVTLAALSIVAGARSCEQVSAAVRGSFWRVTKMSWITSPLVMAFAQRFLPNQLWVPFFSLVGFFFGTYINTVAKKRRIAPTRDSDGNAH
ncbi:integral membrane protein [Fusarium phyllophilum]|uniref:Integral membrane protein n=1 Tax=Fusarium phyllophilum TaxID=47803 RepID=A0A8H5MKA9_9HYPO|nr:integral membrane protein [Fusarium phyllophilum]